MTKLNQIIAVEKGVRAKANRTFTDAHRATLQAERLSGISRTYQPRADDGEALPPESTRVQVTVEDSNRKVADALTRMFDVVLTKDHANTLAKGTVEVDGQEFLPDLPPTFLLFLEKQLVDLRTYVEKLPTLDPAFHWSADPASGAGVSRTDPVVTTRTQKIPHNHVRYEATKEHPAQVDVFTLDEVVGDWTTVKFSGAITQERKQVLLDRVDTLAQAVKFAREQANEEPVTDQRVGATIFEYLFAD